MAGWPYRIRRRAIRPATCTGGASSSIRMHSTGSDDAWRGRPWHEAVLYELHVGTFTRSGRYCGVAEKLDALIELGVTAIELMPVAEAPGRYNWGYDGAYLFAPEASYGQPDDLKLLIETAHRARPDGLRRRRLQPFRPRRELPVAIRGAVLHRAPSHAVGRGDQLRWRGQPRRARFHDPQRALLARGVSMSTGCGSMPCTRSSTTASRMS